MWNNGLYEPTKEDRTVFSKMEIVVLCPMGKPAEPKWIRSLTNMMAYSWMNGLRIYSMGITENVVVDWARNDLARLAYQKKNDYTGNNFSHFLWLDNDQVFNPDLAVVLARHFSNKHVDGVSAVYYMRNGPTLPVVYVKDETDDFTHYPLVIVPETLCMVDAFGFGACMMKRDVFSRVPEPWFTIDYRGGEDMMFCYKARQHGIKWFCDGSYRIGHIGEAPIITHKHYLEHMEKNKDAYADRVKVNLEGEKENAELN